MAPVADPRLVERPELVLTGMSFYGDPFTSHAGWTEENEIGRLWQRLMAHLCGPGSSFEMPSATYEVHVMGDQTPETGEFEVFVGFETPGGASLPVQLSRKTVPAGLFVEADLCVEQMILGGPGLDEWIAAAGYRPLGTFIAMRYDHRYRGIGPDSVLTLLTPVTSDLDEPG